MVCGFITQLKQSGVIHQRRKVSQPFGRGRRSGELKTFASKGASDSGPDVAAAKNPETARHPESTHLHLT